jgi:hypothetical protein
VLARSRYELWPMNKAYRMLPKEEGRHGWAKGLPAKIEGVAGATQVNKKSSVNLLVHYRQ